MSSLHLLLLLTLQGCVTSQKWVVVQLANGGTSKPLLVGDLDHDHHLPPEHPPEALALNAPLTITTVDVPRENSEGGLEKSTDALEKGEAMLTVSQSKLPSTTTTSTTTTTASTTTTTKATTKFISTAAMITTMSQSSQDSTIHPPSTPPLLPCHQSCLGALDTIHLTPNGSIVLRAGSSLTLNCEMSLVPELILEDLLWLFHPEGTPEGQCSLTPHRYLKSCLGFPAFTETDDSNSTYLRQTLILSGLGTNNTGEYMCQVQVTCCPGSQQHVMSQQHMVRVWVQVWWEDYTLDLAVAGVVSGVLMFLLAGVSLYKGRRQGSKGGQYFPVMVQGEVEAPAVLHLPLIDDQDTDSFNSSNMEDEE